MLEIVLPLATEIRQRFPKTIRRNAGYALDMIVNHLVVHDGDPTLSAHVNSAARREGERGFTLSKGKSRGLIDACVALVMLLWLLASPPASDEDGPSVYEERGLVTL